MKRTQDFVFRALLINPLLIAILTGLIFCASKAGAFQIHLQELILAAGTCAVAAELALIPLWVMRNRAQADVSQAGLISTVVHMLASAGLGMTVSTLVHPGASYMYWLLLFYWSTLIAVAALAVRAVRSAPIRVSGSEASVA